MKCVRLLLLGAFALVGVLFGCSGGDNSPEDPELESNNRLLSEPFLQLPRANSVNVVWFSNFAGTSHRVSYGEGREVGARTTQLSRMMEDAASAQLGRNYQGLSERPVYRHEATVSGLRQGQRLDYQVTSIDDSGRRHRSDRYTLGPAPAKGQPLKILLTSDLQLKKNVAANYQKVVETVGRVDAVFFAGDFVNVPDRASEWFDQAARDAPPFFPALQGRYQQYMPEAPYKGGEILQHAPLFGTIGNHEVMGRFLPGGHGGQQDYTLNGGFTDPQPRWYAELAYAERKDEINPDNDAQFKRQWIDDHSHNHTSYTEIFSHPDDGPAGEDYYAVTLGDVFLISMNVSRIWRSWSVSGEQRGKFVEALSQLKDPQAWGYGEFIFEDFGKGSRQYQWLAEVLESEAFKQARYKVVMAHQGVFGLGDNTVPVLAHPVMQLVEAAEAGEAVTELTFPISEADWQREVVPRLDRITELRYQYPISQDLWHRDIEPLLLAKGVDLVFIGHSHLWNRAKVQDLNYLESSNVGNSYGAYFVDDSGVYTKALRADYADFWQEVNANSPRWNIANYAPHGDPQGRQMILPSEFSPMSAENENYPKLPFVASNALSVFSVLETDSGLVKSYVFDPAQPGSKASLFDQFSIAK